MFEAAGLVHALPLVLAPTLICWIFSRVDLRSTVRLVGLGPRDMSAATQPGEIFESSHVGCVDSAGGPCLSGAVRTAVDQRPGQWLEVANHRRTA
jgi:hypothetical protein